MMYLAFDRLHHPFYDGMIKPNDWCSTFNAKYTVFDKIHLGVRGFLEKTGYYLSEIPAMVFDSMLVTCSQFCDQFLFGFHTLNS